MAGEGTTPPILLHDHPQVRMFMSLMNVFSISCTFSHAPTLSRALV
jgi:hypothetical protein